MKNIITLTESDIYRIVNRVIKEGYSEEHLKYTNPKTGKECKIKVAKRVAEQAKEMEKEQIVTAHYQGYRNDIGTTEVSEQYYNETFK